MINFITHLKDTLSNNYLGIKFEPGVVEPFLNELKQHIGEDDFKIFTGNQQRIDHGQYYLTVINVTDYNRLIKEMEMDKFVNSLDSILKYEIDDLKMMGVGTATKNENRSYFIVCKSEKLDAVRKRYELPELDFHITLGFKWKDVSGVKKNEIMEKNNKFLKLLRDEFYKEDNWNFIKRIGNFDLDPKAEVIPVELTETRIKFKCSYHYIDVAYFEDGEKFWIVAKYPVDVELPRLSETEISKNLNKK